MPKKRARPDSPDDLPARRRLRSAKLDPESTEGPSQKRSTFIKNEQQSDESVGKSDGDEDVHPAVDVRAAESVDAQNYLARILPPRYRKTTHGRLVPVHKQQTRKHLTSSTPIMHPLTTAMSTERVVDPLALLLHRSALDRYHEVADLSFISNEIVDMRLWTRQMHAVMSHFYPLRPQPGSVGKRVVVCVY
jgi:hypothetical protein